MEKQKLSYVYALISIVLWSTVATAFKLGLRELNFIQLLWYSSIVSLIALFVIIVLQKKLFLLKTLRLKDIAYSAFLGLLNPFGYYMVLLKAYSLLPAQLAQPLNYTWPIMLVLLSVPLLKQKLPPFSLVAIFISFSGVYFISSKGNPLNFSFEEPFGVFLATFSSIIWALFWIYNVRDKKDEVIKLFLNFVFGLLYVSIVLFLFSDFQLPTQNGLYATLYIGLFEMGITFVMWLKAMQLTNSTAKISNLVFLSPFLALIFIHFILEEKIYWTTFLGIVLIIIGIIIQQIKKI